MDQTAFSKRFEVVCVNEGELLHKAQLLRGEIFFNDPARVDTDKFDKYCDHLVALDHDSGKVIGTYRLLRRTRALEHTGFYSQTEFDIGNILKNCNGELLEMGRACVSTAYRRYPIINLIWKKIVDYIDVFNVRFIFGCASIAYSAQTISSITNYFKQHAYSLACYRVEPRSPVPGAQTHDQDADQFKHIEKNLPSLIKGYLKMGASVCGEPSWDKAFNTADYFMLLDVKKMNEAFKGKFK